MAARLGWDSPGRERAVPGPLGRRSRWGDGFCGGRLITRYGLRRTAHEWMGEPVDAVCSVLLLLAAVMRRTRGRGVALPCRNQLQSHEKNLYAFQTFSLSGEIENTYTVRKKRGPALQKMCFFSFFEQHCKNVLGRKRSEED